MAEPQDSCILWNQLEGATLVSQIGSNGSEYGAPTYGPTKFNNGVIINADTEAVDFPNTGSQFTQNSSMAGVWLKSVGWSLVNAETSDAGDHTVFAMSGDAVNFMHIMFRAAGISWRIRAGAYSGYGSGSFNIPEIDVADGELFHMLVVWNTAGIAGGANTCRIYFNGALVSSTNNAVIMPTVPVGNPFRIGLYTLADLANFDGNMDNIKFYNNTSQAAIDAAVANINNEGWPAGSKPRIRVN